MTEVKQSLRSNDLKKTFSVKGMHCASCVQLIEKAVSKLDGVISCNVNLATEKATVAFDPKKVSDEKISSAVSGVGYKLTDQQNKKSQDFEKKQKEKEL